jgi:hypothetical protein
MVTMNCSNTTDIIQQLSPIGHIYRFIYYKHQPHHKGCLLSVAAGSVSAWACGRMKLLDTGQRLPVHVHPDRNFAAGHLASRYGKTEAWLVLEAAPGAVVHLGFRRDVSPAELGGWVRDQVERADTRVSSELPAAYGPLIVTGGAGTLRTEAACSRRAPLSYGT